MMSQRREEDLSEKQAIGNEMDKITTNVNSV